MSSKNTDKKSLTSWIFLVLLVLPYILLVIVFINHNNKITDIENSRVVIIDKNKLLLNVWSYKGKLEASYPISVGSGYGNKISIGDGKTPEGIFKILSIENSSNWTFDFEDDDAGGLPGAYGPWFIRIEVPGHKGIGIHGNLDRYALQKRNSHGCIRMNNADLNNFKEQIRVNTVVVIVPSIEDIIFNERDTTNVFGVQNPMLIN